MTQLVPARTPSSDNRSPIVVTVGSLHMDLVATASRLPVKGETLPGSEFTMHPGGKGGNQAAQAARFGVESTLICRVGQDHFGDYLMDRLQNHGVTLAHALRDDSHHTGASTVLVGADGDYASVIVPAAAAQLSDGDVDHAGSVLSAASVVLLQLEIPAATSLRAAQIAREHGALIILSAAPAPANRIDYPRELVALTDILLVNHVEAEMLSGAVITSPDSALTASEQLRSLLPPSATVIVTLGGEGLIARTPTSGWHVPAHAVTVQSTLGGGDAFAGALAAELAFGTPIDQAIAVGNAAAALTVSRPGTLDAFPTRAESYALNETRAAF